MNWQTIVIIVIISLSIIILGFAIYGFIRNPVGKTVVISSRAGQNLMTYNCDPTSTTQQNPFNPAPCKTDSDCELACSGSEKVECVSLYKKENNKMVKYGSCLPSSLAAKQLTCNIEQGAAPVYSAGEAGDMTWGCECMFPNYTSATPLDPENSCKLLPNVCSNGTFAWNALETTPEEGVCTCDADYELMLDYEQKPFCVPKSDVNFRGQTGFYPCSVAGKTPWSTLGFCN